MLRIDQHTYSQLRTEVEAGRRIDPFYLKNLTEDRVQSLLRLAKAHNNAEFQAQYAASKKAEDLKAPVRVNRKPEKKEDAPQGRQKKGKKRGKRLVEIPPRQRGILAERNRGVGGRSGGVISRY